MNLGDSKISMKGVRWEKEDLTESEDTSEDELKNPDVIAFIRRCSKKEQAREIINFLLKRGEINNFSPFQ